MGSQIDTNFDFRSDTPPGKDPDSHSPTLRRYHKLLWNKPLPSGGVFKLDDTAYQGFLYHRSKKSEFWLSSDAVVPAFKWHLESTGIIDQVPKEEVDAFYSLGYTIGGMMIFPGNRIDGKITITRHVVSIPESTIAGT